MLYGSGGLIVLNDRDAGAAATPPLPLASKMQFLDMQQHQSHPFSFSSLRLQFFSTTPPLSLIFIKNHKSNCECVRVAFAARIRPPRLINYPLFFQVIQVRLATCCTAGFAQPMYSLVELSPNPGFEHPYIFRSLSQFTTSRRQCPWTAFWRCDSIDKWALRHRLSIWPSAM